MITGLLAGIVWLFGSAAFGASTADIEKCLEENDVGCADAAVQATDAANSGDPAVVALAAEVSFYAGRYDEAYDRQQKAVKAGFVDKKSIKDIDLYARTADLFDNFAEAKRGDVIVRYQPGVDAILIDDAAAAVQGAMRNIGPRLGGPPPGPVIVELYPTGASFIDCSSLTRQDVETTGVVALSKWSRLLVTSPRALGRGYGWQETIAHEFTHLMVSNHSDDKAPVWLQEAIAKYLEARWTDGKDHFRLEVRDEGLLATAVKEEQGWLDPKKKYNEEGVPKGLVPFEKMHPSLAKLPSAEMAALAYAQLATLMQYAFLKGGDDVLTRVLPLVRSGTDPREALAKGVGVADFATLQADWLHWLEQQRLKDANVAAMPTVLDGGGAMQGDPVLAKRVDLAGSVRLGDLLEQKGRPQAALVEYAKAVDPDEPDSPYLSNAVAQAQIDLGNLDAAGKLLERSIERYPEYAHSRQLQASVYARQGRPQQALDAFQAAADLDPFDLAVQQGLIEGYRRLGKPDLAARHEAVLRLLQRGGEDDDKVTMIHPGPKVPTRYVRPAEDAAQSEGAHDETGGDGAILANPSDRHGELFPDLVMNLAGKGTSLSAFKGVVVVDLWATWCGPCLASLPHLEHVAETYGPKGVTVLALSVDKQESTATHFWQGKPPPTFTVGWAGPQTLDGVGVSAIPATFVLDAASSSGIHAIGAALSGYGGASDHRLEDALDAALGISSAPAPRDPAK